MKVLDSFSDVEKSPAQLPMREMINPNLAFCSLRRLVRDLDESLTVCSDRQCYLTLTLFLFFCIDELLLFYPNSPQYDHLQFIGMILLKNYISTAIAVEELVALEKSNVMWIPLSPLCELALIQSHQVLSIAHPF